MLLCIEHSQTDLCVKVWAIVDFKQEGYLGFTKFSTAMKACHLICSRPVVVACVFDDEWRGCAATLWTDGLTQLI